MSKDQTAEDENLLQEEVKEPMAEPESEDQQQTPENPEAQNRYEILEYLL